MKKITVIIGIAAISLTMTACGSFFKSNDNKPSVTGTVSPTAASTTTPAQEATATPTAMPTLSQAPAATTDTPATSTPMPVATATQAPTPSPEPITAAEAVAVLKKYIDTSVYSISDPVLIDVDGKQYYQFTISDASQVYSPDVIVEAQSSKLYYYDSYNVLSAFESFPPDKTETANSQGDTLTQDQAIALLKTLSAETLGLPDTLDSYNLKVDTWNTVVKGNECYCINVLSDKGGTTTLVGMYYVSLDGSLIYKNVEDDFVLIY